MMLGRHVGAVVGVNCGILPLVSVIQVIPLLVEGAETSRLKGGLYILGGRAN